MNALDRFLSAFGIKPAEPDEPAKPPLPRHDRTGTLLADCPVCTREEGRSLCDYCGFFL